MASIILVDDEPEMITAAAGFLSRDGHHCQVFDDALRAREAIASCEFDVLVTDIMMPFVDGLIFVSELDAREKSPCPGIIVMAPLMAVGEPLRGGSSPVDLFLLKPCRAWDIVLAVEALLKHRGQLMTREE